MTDLPAHDIMLARYLDGLLEGEQLRAFEDLLARDPSIQEAIELDRRIVTSLRRTLEPVEAPPRLVFARKRSRGAGARLWLGLAAGIAILFVGIQLWRNASTSPLTGTTARAEPAQIYRTSIERGFQPAWVCEDDAQMLAFTRDRFGSALLFGPVPGVTLVGWGYAPFALGETACTLLVRSGEDRIVLLIDRAKHDRRLQDPTGTGSSLTMHKRRLGPWVLYEITPLDRPIVLDAAYVPPANLQLKPGQSGPGPSGTP